VARLKLIPVFITLVAGVMLAPPLGAQQSAPTPLGTVIKSQSNLVVVDATVTGKKDQPVLDLKQGDFRVFQDGVEQPITAFSAPAGNSANTQKPQYLLLFFDATTVSLIDQKQARAAAVEFVKKMEQPNLYMAAENYTGVTQLVQNFTTDRQQMAKAVSDLKFGNASANADQTATERFLFTVTDQCRSLARLSGRKALVILSGGYAIPEIFKEQVNATIEAANRANVTIYPIDTHGVSDSSLGANQTAGSRGLNSTEVMNRNPSMGLKNVSVLPSSREGTPEMRGPTSKNSVGEELLVTLAQGTGGFTILNSNDFYHALSKVSGDLNENYTVGFVPPANASNVPYHRLEVKVEGHGLKVRARDGYYENQTPDVLSGKPAGNALLEDATGSKPGTIPMSLSAPFIYLGSQKARVNVSLQFPAKTLHIEKSNGEVRYQFNVLGIALRPDGSVAGRFSDSVNETADKEQQQKLAEQPFDYHGWFDIAPGQYRLVVVVSAEGSEFAKSTASLDIPPYDEQSLSLSGIVLSDDLQPVSPLLAGLTGRLSAKQGDLVAGGYQIQPSATRAFPAKGTPTFYIQVYEPALLRPQPPHVGIRCEIINLKSNAPAYESGLLVIDSQVEAGSAVVPVAFKLPMDKLSPGAYRMVVQAADSAGATSAVRSEEFKIE
jgi:VWFA-related protein